MSIINDNYSGVTWRHSDVSLPVKLGIHEHIVDDATGGTDTDALPSSDLTNLGALPKHIGAELRIGGRTFVFARTAANVTIGPGKFASPDYSVQGIALGSIDDGTITGGGKGSRSITITDAGLSGVTLNSHAEAYLGVSDEAGEGYQYKIKSNTAASSNAVTFELYDPIAVTCTTATTDFTLIPNQYDNLMLADANVPLDFLPSGVCQATITADGAGVQQFFWIQVEGPSFVLGEGTLAVGDNLTLADVADGAVQLADAETETRVGYALAAGVDTEYFPIMLNIR